MLSDMALEVIGDFAVVWLLSPTRSFTPRAKSGLARYINALPGHALQVPPIQSYLPHALPSHICCCHNPWHHRSTSLCMTATSVATDSDAVSHSGAITHFITDFILTMTATSATIHSNALGQYRQSFLEMTLLTPPVN